MRLTDEQQDRLLSERATIERSLREIAAIGEKECRRIDQAIRDSDRRAERYLPLLRRYGLAPEQRCRCRLR